jgi:8-oxo-dGTP diphosphatase
MASTRRRPSDLPALGVTVDAVVLTIAQGALQALLVQRPTPPFEGAWALPGGFVNEAEGLDEAAWRVLDEETGTRPGHLEQLGTYGEPGRDPRSRVITVAYLAFVPELGGVGGDDGGELAATAALVPVRRALDRRRTALAFDHHRILTDGVERARSKLEYTSLATAFCPKQFTLSQLRAVYEAAWDQSIDAPNFRRKVLATSGFVTPTGRLAAPGPEGGKPAQLYRAGRAVHLQPPVYRHHV